MASARVLRTALRSVASEAVEAPLSLDDVYRRHCRYVGAVILRVSGRRSELEDLIQDVFAEAASGLDDLRSPEAVRGWLATIAVRLVRRRLRRERIQRLFGLATPIDYEQLADAGASPFDRALIARVYRILDEVAIDDRLAFLLHHLEGETLESVARLCGWSLTTAKRRILRARTVLESRLSDG